MAPAAVAVDLAAAIGVFGEEKSAAEQFALLLKDHANKDQTRYREGVRLYAEARAAFDGLIEQLKFELDKPRSIDLSTEFKKKLDAAVERRVAFTTYVRDTILEIRPGQKGPLDALIKGAGDLVIALTDAGIKIWREFRAVSSDRKKEIRDQLEGLKWRPFAQIG